MTAGESIAMLALLAALLTRPGALQAVAQQSAQARPVSLSCALVGLVEHLQALKLERIDLECAP